MLENTKSFWKESWNKHLDQYLTVSPRTGIFLKNIFGKKVSTVMEIACGSSRDSIYLAKKNYRVIASDFDDATLGILKAQFRYENLKYEVADAFNLPFADDSFDLTFHNGFFILFNDDEEIVKLLTEQARVTKKYILILVHNKNNVTELEHFESLSTKDRLYDVRFWDEAELIKVIRKSKIGCRDIKFLKFGGPADRLYHRWLMGFLPNLLHPFRESLVPRLYQLQQWKNTERIACLVELDK